MKAYREKKRFRPVTIVLETEEEARAMWYRLNCGWSFIREGLQYYYKGHPFVEPSCSCEMWEEFNTAYRSEKT